MVNKERIQENEDGEWDKRLVSLKTLRFGKRGMRSAMLHNFIKVRKERF